MGSWLQPCLALVDPPVRGTLPYPNEKGGRISLEGAVVFSGESRAKIPFMGAAKELNWGKDEKEVVMAARDWHLVRKSFIFNF